MRSNEHKAEMTAVTNKAVTRTKTLLSRRNWVPLPAVITYLSGAVKGVGEDFYQEGAEDLRKNHQDLGDKAEIVD